MKYFCDYCNKEMIAKLRKVHNDGLQHKIAHANYWSNKRSPKEILAIESSKKLCIFFFKRGNCKFGSYCQSTHYTKEQLKNIEESCKLSEISVKRSIIFKDERRTKRKKKKIKKILKNFYKNNVQKYIPSLVIKNYAGAHHTSTENLLDWN